MNIDQAAEELTELLPDVYEAVTQALAVARGDLPQRSAEVLRILGSLGEPNLEGLKTLDFPALRKAFAKCYAYDDNTPTVKSALSRALEPLRVKGFASGTPKQGVNLTSDGVRAFEKMQRDTKQFLEYLLAKIEDPDSLVRNAEIVRVLAAEYTASHRNR